MNIVRATISHRYFQEPFFRPFSSVVDNSLVIMDRADTTGSVIINISGRNKSQKLKKLFFEILELLFIYLGRFPDIRCLEINGEIADQAELIRKYHPSEKYGQLLATCDINEGSISSAAIQGLRTLNKMPLYSMEYLMSRDYDDVNITHRLLLLLHIMEGLVSDQQRQSVVQDLKKLMYPSDKKRKYKVAVYYIFKRTFFYYHRKYNCEILPQLGLTRRTFLNRVTDTRDWYSHFYELNENQHPEKSGRNMLYYFEILFFTTRLFINQQLGVGLKERNIGESYYRIHDWIAETKAGRTDAFKSWAYSLSTMMSGMQTKIETF